MPEQPGPLPSKHAGILAQELLHGRLVLFVGAGLSRLALATDGSDRRLPLWKDLTEQVACACHEEAGDYSFDPLDLFDAVVYGQQRFTLEQAVRAAVDDAGFQVSPAHEALKALPWAAAVTTNYDSLLQRLLSEEPVYEERDYDRLTLPPGQQPRLFQLHGTRRHPHTLTREDYRLWPEKHPRAYRHLEQLVLEKTILFVGYSLSDPHLDSLLAMVRKITAERAKRLYAWMWRLPEGKARLLDRRDKIEAISIDREEEWAAAFGQLHGVLNQCRSIIPSSSPSPPPQRTDLRAATTQYLTYLRDRHQYLSLKGMGLSERTPLQLPLLDLYVPLQARQELPLGETWDRQLRVAGRLLATDEQPDSASRLSDPKPVLDLLQQHDGLVILGDPGAGKTTFLKYLVLQLAAGQGVAIGLGERLPMLAPLSAYANVLENKDIRLDDFIADYFHDLGSDLPLKALLTDALARGAVLVLLDGLDEVQEEGLRHLVVERVVEFFTLRRPAGNKFVITSRIIGYRAVRPVATGLAECTLVDFTDEEITQFVERWTQALEKQAQGDTRLAQADAERERRELLEAVERNAGVRQLAANPLLLTILALMKRQGVTLPERRVELYDQYVKTLLSTWNRARGLGRPPTKDLDPVQILKLLAPLARWMHETNPGVGLVKREAMRRELEALYASRGEADPGACTRQFLCDVHDYASLLLERGPGEYGFIHLTFEEYLTAVAIALQHQGDANAIAQVLAAHAGDTAWHEIALLTVGYVGLVQQMDRIAGAVVETLCQACSEPTGASVVLAGEAVIDAWPAGVTAASKEKVITALVASLPEAAMPAEWRDRAGRALATLGDPRPGVGLREDGLPDIQWVRIPGTEAVRASGRFP